MIKVKKSIWKYPLGLTDPVVITDGIEKFLKVDFQPSTSSVCLWAQVDKNLPKEQYEVTPYGTGQNLPYNPGKYLGTVILHNGEVVLHYYMKKIEPKEVEDDLDNSL